MTLSELKMKNKQQKKPPKTWNGIADYQNPGAQSTQDGSLGFILYIVGVWE